MPNSPPTFTPPRGPGYVLKDVDLGEDSAASLVLLPGGKLLVSGTSERGAEKELVVLRLDSDGAPDPTFGGNGMFRTGAIVQSDPSAAAHDMVVTQSDGTILVVGHTPVQSGADMSVMRLAADGTIDKTFGSEGLVAIDIAGGWDQVDHVFVQRDGAILLIGKANYAGTAMARLDKDGRLDPTFGAGGKVILSDGPRLNIASGVLLPDGRLVLVGTEGLAPNNAPVLMRFKPDGSPDRGFGTDGSVKLSDGGNLGVGALGYSVLSQPDGTLLVVGEAKSSALVTRFLPDGSRDASFGTNGFVFVGSETSYGERFTVVARQADGRIVAAGTNYGSADGQSIIIGRFNADGSTDQDFGINGLSRIELARSSDDAYAGAAVHAIEIDPEGRIVLSGHAFNGVDHDLSILRLLPNGALDPAFGRVTSLGGETRYLAGDPAVRIDFDVSAYDADLASLDGGKGNYAGSHATIQRQGGAVADDEFVALGSLRFDQGKAILSGTVVGDIALAGGSIRVDFDQNATQALVNETLQSIGYRNDAVASPGSIALEWRFSDGSQGLVGNDGSTDAVGVSTVNVTPRVEDYPYWIDSLIFGPSTFGPGSRFADAIIDAIGAERSYLYAFPKSAPSYLSEETYYSNLSPFTVQQAEFAREVLRFISSIADVRFVETADASQLSVLSMMNSSSGGAGSGFAYYPWNFFQGSDVFINIGVDEGPNTVAIYAWTILHEVGHALGLKHPAEPNSLPEAEDRNAWTVMSYRYEGEAPTTARYQLLDIAALQAIYGTSAASRPGNDVYVPSTDSTNFLWDGAGIDTVDASGVGEPMTLHLHPGHWDFIGYRGQTITSPGQITINYGTTIENVIGGSGADSVFGNEASNALAGSAGNDTLSGGLGNDSLVGDAGEDQLFGGEGDDTLRGGPGNDLIDGGVGSADEIAFTGAMSDYSIMYSAPTGQFNVQDVSRDRDGLETVVGVELFRFSDGLRTAAQIVALANRPPVSGDGSNFTPEDSVLSGTLPIASDANGDPLSYSLASNPANGTVVIHGNGSYTYTPNPNFNGADSFTYRASDGTLDSNVAKVTVSILPVNDLPTAGNGSDTTAEDSVLTGTLPLAVDVDGDGVSYSRTTFPSKGTVIVNADGSYVYSPSLDAWGQDSFTFSITDGHGGTNTYVQHVNVIAVVDHIGGTAGNDTLMGHGDADVMVGLAGQDRMAGLGGNDTLDGGAGIDVAVYNDSWSRHSITLGKGSGAALTWTVTTPSEGTDTLVEIERIQFANTSLALDLDANGISGMGNAGIAAKVINALLGPGFLQDRGVVGIVLDLLDRGTTYEQLVGIAVSHPAFSHLAGAGGGPVSAQQFVNHVYQNVVGSLPDPGSLSVFSGYLTRGELTQANLGFIACETDFNKAAVNLVGLGSTGIEYIPQLGE